MSKNQEFYQLSAEQLASLLKSDDLNVPSEQEVFNALMDWVQHDFSGREKHIPDLLALIRLPLLSPAVSILNYSLYDFTLSFVFIFPVHR